MFTFAECVGKVTQVGMMKTSFDEQRAMTMDSKNLQNMQGLQPVSCHIGCCKFPNAAKGVHHFIMGFFDHEMIVAAIIEIVVPFLLHHQLLHCQIV